MTDKGRPATAKKKQEKRPSEILEILNDSGWNFRVNVANDEIECNGVMITDNIASQIRCFAKEHRIGMTGLQALHDVCVMGAMQNPYHPVAEYLEKARSEHGSGGGILEMTSHFKSSEPLICYDNGTSARAVDVYVRKFLIGAVAKALHGEQNIALVIEGPQDCGKSFFAQWLCGGILDYHIEAPLYGHEKDLDMSLISNWIWEISELDATTAKKDVAAIKAFITKQSVETRPPYGRYRIKKPAMASFIGTVNPGTGFLSDESGNRRFLCFRISGIDWKYSKIDPGMIWAEAHSRYMSGETWKLTNEEKYYQSGSNRSFDVETPLEDFIKKYFTITEDPLDFVSTADLILTLRKFDIPVAVNKATSMEISRIMNRLGARKARISTVRGYSSIKKENKDMPTYDDENQPHDEVGQDGGRMDKGLNQPNQPNQPSYIEDYIKRARTHT